MSAKPRPMTALCFRSHSNDNLHTIREEKQQPGTIKLRRRRLDSAKSSRNFPLQSYQSELQVAKNAKGQTADFLESRKQDILKSCFNRRKRELLEITKENRRIYERINSQQSNYSTKNGNTSFDSNISKSQASRKLRPTTKTKRPLSRNFSGKGKLGGQEEEVQKMIEKKVSDIGEDDLGKFKNAFFADAKETKKIQASLPLRMNKALKKKKLKKGNNENREAIAEEKAVPKKQIINEKYLQNRNTSLFKQLEMRPKRISVCESKQNSSRIDKIAKIFSEIDFRHRYR